MRSLVAISTLVLMLSASSRSSAQDGTGPLDDDRWHDLVDLASDYAVGFSDLDHRRDAAWMDGFVQVDWIHYEVAPGDTLSGIAADYDVSVSQLRSWNSLSNDVLQIGQDVRIYTRGGGAERVRETYRVRSGDTGIVIARRHGVSFSELERWNSSVDLNRLRVGQELSIYVSSGGDSGSRGSPDSGRLRGGVQLGEGTGYVVRDMDRAYGTPDTVWAIRNGIARVTARYVDVPTLDVHDLSYERGGTMSPHLSHQNGLDADISYYRLDTDGHSGWQDCDPEDLDVELQWYLFRSWIEQGLVEYIFVDYDLQAPLYEYAVERGATEDELERWFQYPERSARDGIIRHEPGHDDHFHIRFHPVE